MSIHHPINPAPDNAETWTTDQLRDQFDVLAFGYGLVAVTRKSDGQRGTLQFNGSPRVYHSFAPEPPSTIGIPYAPRVGPDYKTVECPVCHQRIAETNDEYGEDTSQNYARHYADVHA